MVARPPDDGITVRKSSQGLPMRVTSAAYDESGRHDVGWFNRSSSFLGKLTMCEGAQAGLRYVQFVTKSDGACV